MKSLLLFAGLLALPLPALFTAPSAPATPGPGGVIAMHKQLFAAIDAGDAERARSFVTDHKNSIDQGACVFYLPGRDDKPRRVEGAQALGDCLAQMAKESAEAGGRFETRIAFARDDCRSEESYAILEFERTHEKDGARRTDRFRSSSLVRGTSNGWKLFHWHVSRVDSPSTVMAR